jgi:hypothetical protein
MRIAQHGRIKIGPQEMRKPILASTRHGLADQNVYCLKEDPWPYKLFDTFWLESEVRLQGCKVLFFIFFVPCFEQLIVASAA